MFSRDRWSKNFKALTTNWFRTLLTAFGVLWGIFILMILLAAGRGLENGVKQGFGDMATNSMFMWSQTASRSYKGLPKGRNYSFRINDVAAIREAVPGLRFISPRNQLGGFGGSNNVIRGLQTGPFNVYGDYPEGFKGKIVFLRLNFRSPVKRKTFGKHSLYRNCDNQLFCGPGFRCRVAYSERR